MEASKPQHHTDEHHEGNPQSDELPADEHGGNEDAGKKFFVNIEGTEYPWDRETITVPEIRQLGSIPADQSIVQESPDGTERTLAEGESIELKPGHRLGRTAKYKRG